MKAIAILGSPKGMQGYTGALVEPLMKAMQQEGIDTDIFSLSDLAVQPCKGCQNICHITGTCHQKDDFEKIKQAMLAADGIIFATPNYTLQVSAQMKALIDFLRSPKVSLHPETMTIKTSAMARIRALVRGVFTCGPLRP